MTDWKDVKIEKGIPVPKKPKWLSILKQMEPGDSFFIPESTLPISQGYALVSFAARNGMKAVARKWEENGETGIRVWRVE